MLRKTWYFQQVSFCVVWNILPLTVGNYWDKCHDIATFWTTFFCLPELTKDHTLEHKGVYYLLGFTLLRFCVASMDSSISCLPLIPLIFLLFPLFSFSSLPMTKTAHWPSNEVDHITATHSSLQGVETPYWGERDCAGGWRGRPRKKGRQRKTVTWKMKDVGKEEGLGGKDQKIGL